MASPDPSNSPWISSTTDATFARDVFERSQDLPVVVDFWAAWCAPCRALAPLLERLAIEYDGKFQLVKAETEHNQSAAAQFNVGGIPAVYGVVAGQLADEFAGALPEAQVRAWLDRVLLINDAERAHRLEATDPAAAEARYRALIEQLPRQPELQIGLARTLLEKERCDEVQAIITQLEARGFLEPEAQNLKAALGIAQHGGGDVAQLRAAADAAPNDLSRQFELATALAAAGEHEEALQRCLAIIAAQKTGVGEEAKQLMLDIFRVLPAGSDLTSAYRRKLTSLLY